MISVEDITVSLGGRTILKDFRWPSKRAGASDFSGLRAPASRHCCVPWLGKCGPPKGRFHLRAGTLGARQMAIPLQDW